MSEAKHISWAVPGDDFSLILRFKHGELRSLDMKPLLENETWAELKDPEMFNTVEVDDLGGLEWDNGLTYCPDTAFLGSSEKKTWTEMELMRLPKEEGRHELVGGKLVVMPLFGFKEAELVAALIAELGNVVPKQDLGRVFASNLGYWMSNGNLRCPVVSFVPHDRLSDMTRDPKGFLHGAPDLAIEILYGSGTLPAMKKKAREYFENGSRLVWIIDPDSRNVTVLRPDGSERVLMVEDALTGEDVVPGFSLKVSELFLDLSD